MLESEADNELFNASFKKCTAEPGFMDQFYKVFIESSPKVTEKFKNTDFNKQVLILKTSLYLIYLASKEVHEGKEHLKHIAETHNREGYDIEPELYDVWLDCLIETVKQFDESLTPETEQAWRSVMNYGISYMKSRY